MARFKLQNNEELLYSELHYWMNLIHRADHGTIYITNKRVVFCATGSLKQAFIELFEKQKSRNIRWEAEFNRIGFIKNKDNDLLYPGVIFLSLDGKKTGVVLGGFSDIYGMEHERLIELITNLQTKKDHDNGSADIKDQLRQEAKESQEFIDQLRQEVGDRLVLHDKEKTEAKEIISNTPIKKEPRFCYQCGAQLNITANFCGKCGSRIRN